MSSGWRRRWQRATTPHFVRGQRRLTLSNWLQCCCAAAILSVKKILAKNNGRSRKLFNSESWAHFKADPNFWTVHQPLKIALTVNTQKNGPVLRHELLLALISSTWDAVCCHVRRFFVSPHSPMLATQLVVTTLLLLLPRPHWWWFGEITVYGYSAEWGEEEVFFSTVVVICFNSVVLDLHQIGKIHWSVSVSYDARGFVLNITNKNVAESNLKAIWKL